MQSLIHDVRNGVLAHREDEKDNSQAQSGTLEYVLLIGATVIGTVAAILLDSVFNLFS